MTEIQTTHNTLPRYLAAAMLSVTALAGCADGEVSARDSVQVTQAPEPSLTSAQRTYNWAETSPGHFQAADTYGEPLDPNAPIWSCQGPDLAMGPEGEEMVTAEASPFCADGTLTPEDLNLMRD